MKRLFIAVLLFANAPAFACVTNVVPFGVTTNIFTGKTLGDTIVVDNDGIGSGKYGKLDLAGYANSGAWLADMRAFGCACLVCTGGVPVITGNANINLAFRDMLDAVYIVPLVTALDTNGISLSTIVGFTLVKEVSYLGAGANWTTTLQLLSAPLPVNELTADSDGDGQSDFAEYLAGTEPTNSASFFGITSVAIEGNDVRITWATAAGKTNALQRGVLRGYGTLFTVTNALTGTTNYLNIGVVTNSVGGFYRVKLVP